MLKKRVLVFPCGSEIGLELHRSLWCAKEVELFGGSTVADHGSFVYARYLEGIPHVDADGFLERFNDVIERHQIQYVFPAHDSVILKLALAQRQGRLGCGVITSPHETCRICRSKKLTLGLFARALRTTRIYENIEGIENWPVFLKPDVGQGSKGTAIANNPEECSFLLRRDPSLLILEYLPGAEYTVDCFTDRNRQLIFVGGRERIRVQNGISVNTKPVQDPAFKTLATTINDTLEMRGMWFFQVKRTNDSDLALMEIAPRLAGGMGMYRNLGVNFALMSLYDAEGSAVEILVNDFSIEMDRALDSKFKLGIKFEHVYVDFDDCVFVDDSLNTDVVKFLYQCRNRGIELHLLTRHAGSILQVLQEYGLVDLFKTVDHLHANEPKSQFIKHGCAVFIDDSFSERKEVKGTLGIPVFAPDAVESLLSNDT